MGVSLWCHQGHAGDAAVGHMKSTSCEARASTELVAVWLLGPAQLTHHPSQKLPEVIVNFLINHFFVGFYCTVFLWLFQKFIFFFFFGFQCKPPTTGTPPHFVTVFRFRFAACLLCFHLPHFQKHLLNAAASPPPRFEPPV